MCLEYTDTKNLFGEDISKSLVKAKEVGGLCKQFQPETYKNSQGSKHQNRFKRYSAKDSFLHKNSHQYKGPPQARNNRNNRKEIDDLFSKAKKQVDTYIKSLPKLKTFFQWT